MIETLSRPESDEQIFTHIDLSTTEHQPLPPNVLQYELPSELKAEVDQFELPRAYGLVGGAARDIALGVFTGESLPVRDVDVVAFRDLNADTSPNAMHAISARLMPDDYAYGHGVREDTLDTYFVTRDLTMNEVTVVDGRLLLTPEAEIALRQGIIQPTKYQHNPEIGTYLSPNLAVKAVLLQSVLENAGFNARIEGFDPQDYQFRTAAEEDDDVGLRPFPVALGFRKALEYGPDTARVFLDRMISYGMISHDSITNRHNDGHLTNFARQLAGIVDGFEFSGEAADWIAAIDNVGIGDMLEAISPDVMAEYDRYHEMAQDFGGKGREYTDERKY
jgi:hypothetical protein